MDEYNDYDDDDVNDSVDSDDDEIKFVSSKRKFKFTTFGDDVRHDVDDDDGFDGKESSIYGVFAESNRSRINDKKPPSAPIFVKGSSRPLGEEKDNTRKLSQIETVQVDAPTAEEEVDEEAEEAKKAAEALGKKQEEANQKFLALLGRGRGEKRPRRTFDDDDLEMHKQTGGGLGFQSEGGVVGGGLGFKPSPPHAIDSKFGGLGGSLPSNFGERQTPLAPIKVDPNLGKWEKHTKGIGMKLLAKMGYSGSGGLGAQRKIDAEGPSKGGISRPVEVVVRPTNLGLGFGNFKEAAKLKVNQEIEAEIRGEELPKIKEEKKSEVMGAPLHKRSALQTTDELMGQESWKRGVNQISRKRQKRTIVPYTELLQTEHQPVIIDMRGPSTPNTSGEVPLAAELLHNVSMLLNTYENKLHSTSHFLIASNHKLQSLQSDLDGMERRQAKGRQRIAKLQEILKVVDSIDDLFIRSDVHVGMSDRAQLMVEELRGSLSEEDRSALQFDQVLVPSLLSPFINSLLNQWKPLAEGPDKAASIVNSLLNLGSNSNDVEVGLERKLSILSRDLLPKLKAGYESTQWNPIRDVEAGVALYEALLNSVDKHSSLPNVPVDDSNVFLAGDPDHISLRDTLARELLRKTIFPKIMRVLSLWKPHLNATETRVHDGLESWLLPWLPHLDHPATISQILSDLARKLRSSLSCLNRGVVVKEDFLRSSMATLRPWRPILKKETVFDLTSKYIIPRVLKSLSSISIEFYPNQQDWFVINTLIDLYNTGLMSHLEFVSLVEGEVLASWADDLYSHLQSQAGLNPEQLALFYFGWKLRVFGPPSSMSHRLLQRDEVICRIFYSGLKMIETAAMSATQRVDLGAPKTSTYREVLARRSKEERLRNEDDLERLQSKDSVDFRKRVIGRQFGASATFLEVVEDVAREHDISFRPRTGGKSCTDDGKPIFLFGMVPIYLDTNVIFALQESIWTPLAMEDLVAMAKETVNPSDLGSIRKNNNMN